VDLRDAAVLAVAERADQGDDVEAERVLRQGEGPLRLGAEADAAAGALGVPAATDLEPQPDKALEGGDRPLGLERRPQRPAASGAVPSGGEQFHGPIGLGTCIPSRHALTPGGRSGSMSNS
jgi:hypothetical protein